MFDQVRRHRPILRRFSLKLREPAVLEVHRNKLALTYLFD
jgi:hypothetical protein